MLHLELERGYRSFHPDTVFSSISNTPPISTALYPLLKIRIALMRSHFFLSLSARCRIFSSRTSLSLNSSFIPSFSHDPFQKTHETLVFLSLDSIPDDYSSFWIGIIQITSLRNVSPHRGLCFGTGIDRCLAMQPYSRDMPEKQCARRVNLHHVHYQTLQKISPPSISPAP